MIYTPLTKRAMEIAYQAHHGQKDAGGVPYIFHAIHLAEQMKEEKTELVSFCGIIEGKFFIRRVKLDEDEEEIDETERIHCYDLAAKSGKMLSENDPEYLYYLLV